MEILKEALKGCSKTRLMYRCNLNFRCFNGYLNELLDKNLLVKVKHQSRNGVLYRTSDKGKELLEALTRVMELLSG